MFDRVLNTLWFKPMKSLLTWIIVRTAATNNKGKFTQHTLNKSNAVFSPYLKDKGNNFTKANITTTSKLPDH